MNLSVHTALINHNIPSAESPVCKHIGFSFLCLSARVSPFFGVQQGAVRIYGHWVPSRIMRKKICRPKLNEISRQQRRHPKPPPNTSYSCTFCCPTGYPTAKPRTDQHRRGVPIREYPHHTGPETDLSVRPLNHIVCTYARPMFAGKVKFGSGKKYYFRQEKISPSEPAKRKYYLSSRQNIRGNPHRDGYQLSSLMVNIIAAKEIGRNLLNTVFVPLADFLAS